MDSPSQQATSETADQTHPGWPTSGGRLTAAFLVALSILLAGYMFMGRGFAHLGRPPLYIGEVVLLFGLIATAVAFFMGRVRARPLLVVWLVLGFMVLGLVRTVPYLGVYGVDALRDAVLWGYALFALMILVLADRAVVLRALRLYGWIVPLFALWLPISYKLFASLSAGIQADERGSNVPLVFFKSGDMAVHIVGSIAFLVLGVDATKNLRTFAWRVVIAAPLLWTAFFAGSTNRGGLLTVAIGTVAIAGLAVVFRRSRNWIPLLVAPVVVVIALATTGILSSFGTGAPIATSTPAASASGSPVASRASETPVVLPTCDPSPVSGSLVTNPSFELGPVSDGKIEGWATWAGAYNIVGGGGYQGANYASIKNTGEPWSATITSSKFPFPAGRDITVSLWVKAIDGSPAIATYVTWYNASGTVISTVFLSSMATSGGRTWQESMGSLTAPAATTQADVQLFETSGNATIGVDEVDVHEAAISCDAAPASRSLAANPGFEVGTLRDGRIQAWATWAGLYNIVAGEAYRGANYASVENTGEAWMASITSTKFRFRAGQDIKVSLWAKAIDGSPVIATYVNWYDSSDTLISSVFLDFLTTNGSHTWKEGDGALTAPPGTARADVQLFETAGHTTVGLEEVIVKSGHFVVGAGLPARETTIDQIIRNIGSIFSFSSDAGLEGSKTFRLKWWGTIVDYTVFGKYFWTGKGFGVNLADADGFQVNPDDSLRTPHNTHITTLARMGVPGLVLWLLLQAAFGIGLLRAVLAHRRAGDMSIAIVGAWILVYWVAMMVDTSFDPYLEGPQGGIWFWTLFGLGMVVMRLIPRRAEA